MEYDPQYEAAWQHYETGQFERAEQLVQVALLELPEDGRWLQLQGLIWHGKRRFAAACRAFELAMTLVPLTPMAQLAMADAYRHCGQRGDAHTILSYLATRSDLPTALLPNLTIGLGGIGDYQRALDVCREASQREPENDAPLFGMAFYMNKLAYPIECVLPLMRCAVSLAPDCRTYRTSLAMLCGRAGLWSEAYELFCDLPPDGVRCQNCLHFMIRVFERIGDHPRRDACLCRLLQIAHERAALAEEAES